jgi:excisionase family DNA binding protein
MTTWFSVQAVASQLGVNYTTVIRLINSGDLAAVDLSVRGSKRRLKIEESALDDFLNRRRIGKRCPPTHRTTKRLMCPDHLRLV